MDVKTESQSQKTELIVCNCCRRSLPQSYFGLLRSSKTGYNPTCYECRRYLRNKSYHKENYSGDVFSLKANNRIVWESFKDVPKDLIATDLQTGQYIRIEVVKLEKSKSLKLLNLQGETIEWFLCSYLFEFEETVLELLYKRRLRLINHNDQKFHALT